MCLFIHGDSKLKLIENESILLSCEHLILLSVYSDIYLHHLVQSIHLKTSNYLNMNHISKRLLTFVGYWDWISMIRLACLSVCGWYCSIYDWLALSFNVILVFISSLSLFGRVSEKLQDIVVDHLIFIINYEL